MVNISRSIDKMENQCRKKPEKASALSLLYFKYYVLNKDVSFLSKAYELTNQQYTKNVSSVDLLLLSAFYAVEMDQADRAEELIKNFHRYRNYYKNNNILYYGFYIYIKALSDKRLGKERSFKKSIKTLLAIDSVRYMPLFQMLAADLYMKNQDFEEALYIIESAYEKGCRSFYLFILMDRLFSADFYIEETAIFLPFIKWAKKQGTLKPYYIKENEELASQALEKDFELFLAIYEDLKAEPLLHGLAQNLILKENYSHKAYKIYQNCIDSYLYVSGLNEAYIRSCALNDIRDIDTAELKRYIETNKITEDLKAYIYHILLSNRDLNSLISVYQLENYILQYASYCLENKLKGKYYYSLYTYLLKNADSRGTAVLEAEKAVFENLFKYTVLFENDFQGSLVVFEKEMGTVSEYKVILGKADIFSCSRDFLVTPISKEGQIEQSEFTLKSEYEMDRKWICRYFLHKGYKDANLIICLSSIYINENTLDREAIKILEDTLYIEGISDKFRLNIYTALGRHYLKNKAYDKAYKYYSNIDENLLSNDDLILMLDAFVNYNQAESVYMVITRKGNLIPDRDLFAAVKYLSGNEHYHSKISNLAYELIMKGWYDSRILDIVLKYYNGSLKNWYSLSSMLKNMDIDSLKLDEIILESAVWMRIFDAEVQKVFRRVYKKDKDNEYLEAFAYYAVYEIIANKVRPEYETISVLEKLYIKNKDALTAYALGSIYIKYTISTFYSDLIMKDVLKFIEEDQFFMPEFKKLKDKNVSPAYIEKNEPFIYQSAFGNKVYINFKYSEDTEYTKKEMKYFKFGIFYAMLPVFYGDEISYYFTEEKGRGSIETKIETVKNENLNLNDDPKDIYYVLNNALIYNKMFKYEEAESLITQIIGSEQEYKCELL